jgi:hypothetical protein
MGGEVLIQKGCVPWNWSERCGLCGRLSLSPRSSWGGRMWDQSLPRRRKNGADYLSQRVGIDEVLWYG